MIPHFNDGGGGGGGLRRFTCSAVCRSGTKMTILTRRLHESGVDGAVSVIIAFVVYADG